MKKKQRADSTPFQRFVFLIYTTFLLWLLFDRPTGWDPGIDYAQAMGSRINLTPFHTIGSYLHVLAAGREHPLFRHSIINLGGNIFLFIPIGYFLPKLWLVLRRFFAFLLTCFLAITLVELLQLVTLLGSLDIDDLILNLFGMLIGYILFMIFKK